MIIEEDVVILECVVGSILDGKVTEKASRYNWKEESRKSLFANNSFFFVGTDGEAVLYVLAKPFRVVLVSLILIPYMYNQYIAQLNSA